jgi:hypothetical protein
MELDALIQKRPHLLHGSLPVDSALFSLVVMDAPGFLAKRSPTKSAFSTNRSRIFRRTASASGGGSVCAVTGTGSLLGDVASAGVISAFSTAVDPQTGQTKALVAFCAS